jgi:hypothetical protein
MTFGTHPVGNLQFQESTRNFSDTKNVMLCRNSSLDLKVRIDEQCNHTVYKMLLR